MHTQVSESLVPVCKLDSADRAVLDTWTFCFFAHFNCFSYWKCSKTKEISQDIQISCFLLKNSSLALIGVAQGIGHHPAK